jgi:Spy/CpxP family protein refolding chaperone
MRALTPRIRTLTCLTTETVGTGANPGGAPKLVPTIFCNSTLAQRVCSDERKPPVLTAASLSSRTRKILHDVSQALQESHMKKIALSLLAVAYATRLFAQAVDPSPPDQSKTETQPFGRSMHHRFWERLHVTDDQKQKLKQIREADQDSLCSAWAQVTIARESLKAALLANPENTADIQTKAINLANALSTSSVQMALHRAKINQVLTPAQRVALEETRHHRMRRWDRHGGGAEEGRWQERRPLQRQNQQPQQTPATPQESQTPATPTS